MIEPERSSPIICNHFKRGLVAESGAIVIDSNVGIDSVAVVTIVDDDETAVAVAPAIGR